MSGNISKKERIKKMCDSMGSRYFTSIMVYDGMMDETSDGSRKRRCIPTVSQIEQHMSRLDTIEKVGKCNGMIQYKNKDMVENDDY